MKATGVKILLGNGEVKSADELIHDENVRQIMRERNCDRPTAEAVMEQIYEDSELYT